MHTNQGCALRKIEGSPVLWACKIQGAQHMICMKKLWFSSHPRTKVRFQGPPWALLEHTPMGEKKSWSEASQMNGWEREERGGALWPVMQPNEILLSCSDWSNVLALTDSQYWCQISLHLVASGDSLLACSPVTLGIISSTPSLFHFAEGHAGWWDKGSRTFLSLK